MSRSLAWRDAVAAPIVSTDGRAWIAVGWMVALGTRLVIPTLLPQITAEFDISNTTTGAAVTLLWLTYAGVQFPAGALADGVGERRILLASVGIAASGVVLFAVAPTLTAFFVACAAFGLGTGLFVPPRVTIISRTFPTRDGTVMGISFAAGNVGAAVLPFVTGVLAVRFGWRSGVSFVLPVFLLVCYAIWRTVPRPRGADGRGRSVAASDRLATRPNTSRPDDRAARSRERVDCVHLSGVHRVLSSASRHDKRSQSDDCSVVVRGVFCDGNDRPTVRRVPLRRVRRARAPRRAPVRSHGRVARGSRGRPGHPGRRRPRQQCIPRG